jgi:hypothetical protein
MAEYAVSTNNQTTILTRNARFLWLGALFVPPVLAFLAYQWTPHEAIWHEVLYSILCLPIFCFWVIALFGCIISFLSYRSMLVRKGRLTAGGSTQR